MDIEGCLNTRFRQIEIDIFTDKEMRDFYATRWRLFLK